MNAIDECAWMDAINQMQQAEKKLDKDEIWAVAATHRLADIIVELSPALTAHQREALIDLGAFFARQGLRETMAAIEADLALRRVAFH
jgi:glutathione synthase/RimK-type ligase-like ATP-grasp enzyme